MRRYPRPYNRWFDGRYSSSGKKGSRQSISSKYFRDWAESAWQERSEAGVVLHSLSPVSFWGKWTPKWPAEFSKTGALVSKMFWLVEKEETCSFLGIQEGLIYNFFLSSLQNSEYGMKFCPKNRDNITVTCCFVTRADRKPVWNIYKFGKRSCFFKGRIGKVAQVTAAPPAGQPEQHNIDSRTTNPIHGMW